MKRFKLLFICMCMLVFVIPTRSQSPVQPSNADRVRAAEEFRRGVQAYYRGYFNEAVLVFEKALSYIPGEPRILDWLGKAYYRTGVEGAALQQWQFALEAAGSDILLQNRIEIIRERRTISPVFDDSVRYVEAGLVSSRTETGHLFRQPVSVLPLQDGTFWVSAYGSNELLHFDVNGVVIERSRGPVGGFDRPFGLARLSDGRILVAEMAADRVSVIAPQGSYISSFGSSGRGAGQLLGPQYLALDSAENIYVSDFGNARISVFNREGEFLFSFGERSPLFGGFTAPTGIAIIDDRVYVADTVTGALSEFDRSGNFTRLLLPEGTVTGCEALQTWNGSLVAALPSRAVFIDSATGAHFDLARLGNAPMRITAASPDSNGNILLADYHGESIQVTSRMSELVGGLFVQIERVYADTFPAVTIEVRVEDRNRNPVVGLKSSNFMITEGKRPVTGMKLTGSGYREEACDVTVLIDRSADSDAYRTQIRDAIHEISAAMNGRGTLRIVSAGAVPVQEGAGNPATGSWSAFHPKAAASGQWAFDLGLRLAANDLVTAGKKRAVVFLSTGSVSQSAFDRYSLNDLAAYLNNNGIIFSTVYLDQNPPPAEFAYLTRTTGGSSYYVYRHEGLSAVVDDLVSAPNGVYVLSFESALPTDFGRAYLPVEIEVYLMNRSGRDESGYFAPLD